MTICFENSEDRTHRSNTCTSTPNIFFILFPGDIWYGWSLLNKYSVNITPSVEVTSVMIAWVGRISLGRLLVKFSHDLFEVISLSEFSYFKRVRLNASNKKSWLNLTNIWFQTYCESEGVDSSWKINMVLLEVAW